jgi:hypothetical protein
MPTINQWRSGGFDFASREWRRWRMEATPYTVIRSVQVHRSVFLPSASQLPRYGAPAEPSGCRVVYEKPSVSHASLNGHA